MIYYTKNICEKSYSSIKLICEAESMREALKKFNYYVKSKNSSWYPKVSVNQIKLLNKEVKSFCCIE